MYLLWPYLASCDHTWPCLMSLGSIRVTSTLGTILSSRFGPPVSAVTNRSQQAARADLTSQSCPQHARAAACTGIWPLERAGRPGSSSARPPKSPVRAGPAGAAGRRGHGGRPSQILTACGRGRGDCMQPRPEIRAETPRTPLRTGSSRRMLETNRVCRRAYSSQSTSIAGQLVAETIRRLRGEAAKREV